MKALAYGGSVLAVVAFLACGDDDASIPSPSDAGASSSSSGATTTSSSSSSSGTATSSSSSSSSSGASGSPAQEKVYCDAVASRKADCGKGDGICSESGKCFYAKLMSPEATNLYAACYGAPTCKGDDTCIAEAGIKLGGTAATDYYEACKKKYAECPSTFKDDYCSPAAYAYTGVGEASTACLAKTCAEIKDCFTTAYTALAACK